MVQTKNCEKYVACMHTPILLYLYLPMHEEQRLPELNDLSKSLLAKTGLQQSSNDEPEAVAPTQLKLALKHCASAAADYPVTI